MNMWLLALAIFFVLGAVMVAEIRAKPLRRLKAAAKATTDPTIAEAEFEQRVRYAVTLLRHGSASQALRELRGRAPIAVGFRGVSTDDRGEQFLSLREPRRWLSVFGFPRRSWPRYRIRESVQHLAEPQRHPVESTALA